MTDAFQQPILIGDKVVYSSYSVRPIIGVVKEFTPKKVRMENGDLKDPKDIVVFTAQYNYAIATWPEIFI